MPVVACPSCGERGKIPPTLVGARIKCRKCGTSFNVLPAAARAAAGAAVAGAGAGTPAAAVAESTHEGISVDGLDASAWTFQAEPGGDARPAEAHLPSDADHHHAFEAHGVPHAKEYKFLCSRDKVFEGKFDLARLEELLNTYARQGWSVKGMSSPHLKDFGGNSKEEIVVLLER
ncbi:hypothetical protein OJF2_55380 [Aquisphaera giovannonii]|uniref:DUF4177 domain-containing protein n=1 Tax=Aquisphaera giovannonii TaxID=406548 RepID=A0A5B9W8V6_9BACT|nr:DUF4177 domain-containing protein [Aquisphaera giovannonii]QEH36953.1 hypothetical protein OJF2_55380 [Aquisphaera giovannonii]